MSSTRYLLDTCILSELFKERKDARVTRWVTRQNQDNLFWSVVTVGEIQKGIAKLSDGHKSRRLTEQFQAFLTDFEDRVLPLDEPTMLNWGRLCGESEQRGLPLPVMDSLIAATAQHQGMVVVTRNVSDLERCGAIVVNPWSEGEG
jgi:predicted nucleic acid-binding protein